MPGTESEKGFLDRIAAVIPGAAGYRAPSARAETDRRLREYVAGAIQALIAKIQDLRQAAEAEGEEDMVEDLDQIAARMRRTAESLRGARYDGTGFFGGGAISQEDLERVCAYDGQVLDDLDLLVRDVTGLKYETIGNLTLREVEGTLAAIELKVANRGDVFAACGGRDAG